MIPEKENPQTDGFLAEDSVRGLDGASSLPSKIARYSEARRKALLMRSFAQDNGHVKESAALAGCGNYLLFHHYTTIDKVKLAKAHTCKQHLLCPLCAIRRATKMLAAYLQRYEVVTAENKNLTPYLVTFTVKNGDDLTERVNHLRNALKKLRKAKNNYGNDRGPWTEFARAEGGFSSLEVTNKGKGWHPHVHMIWLCESEPDQAALKREWLALTGDSHQVDVRPLTDPVKGFVEVCKYALKFGDLSLHHNWEAYEALKGQRMVQSFGNMWGVKVPEKLTDDLLDDLPYQELFYQYLPGSGYTLRQGKKEAPHPQRIPAKSAPQRAFVDPLSLPPVLFLTPPDPEPVKAAQHPKGSALTASPPKR